MSSLSLASRFAARLSESRSIESLRSVWQEVNDARKEMTKEDYDWVRCFKGSRKMVLSPEPPDEEIYSKEGLKWLRKTN